MRILFILSIALITIHCEFALSQEQGNSHIKLIVDKDKVIINKDIEFADCYVDTVIQAYVLAQVDFDDPLSSKPTGVFIQRLLMNKLNTSNNMDKVHFNVLLSNLEGYDLNYCERYLIDKYLPKADSIYMNSTYEFADKETSITRIGLGIPFKIKPK